MSILMAATHKKAVLLKLSKPDLFQLLLNIEATIGAHIASLTAEIRRINKHLKKEIRSRCLCHKECKLPFSRLVG